MTIHNTSLSEIFRNSRSLSREDLEEDPPITKVEELIKYYGIPKRDLCLPETQLNIGLKFLDGYPVQVNKEQARIWICRAADKRLPEAAHVLGKSYVEGTFTEKNVWFAYAYLKVAADSGIDEAKLLIESSVKSHP